jgi:hypothetical protein
MPASKLDSLPIEAQMVAETIIEGHGKPIPAAALAEFPGLAARLAQVDAGFAAIPSDEEEHYNSYGPEPEPEPEYSDYPDPEPVTLPFPEPNRIDAQIAEYLSEPTDKLSVQDEPSDYELGVVSDDGSEDLEEEEDAADEFFEDDGDEPAEEENEYIALLTPEIMEKMLANMRANGIIV